MSKLRRYFADNTTVFLTSVTIDRRPILIEHIDLFQVAMVTARRKLAFETIAWVVLPDHFHVIAEAIVANPSDIMQRIKLSFSANLRSRLHAGSGRIWQHRFWDHRIRGQIDLNTHIDYIHYNPVKHGYVQSPSDWKYSSIHQYRVEGYYSKEWGSRKHFDLAGEYGE